MRIYLKIQILTLGILTLGNILLSAMQKPLAVQKDIKELKSIYNNTDRY